MILCSFLLRFQWKTLESHNSKQMPVYEQITFFIKSIDCSIFFIEHRFFDWKIDFWIEKRQTSLNTGKNSKIGVGGRREAPSILPSVGRRHRRPFLIHIFAEILI